MRRRRDESHELIFITEVWEAPLVGPDARRFGLRPGERDHRREALVTYALARSWPCHTWRSGLGRDPDGAILLEEAEYERRRLRVGANGTRSGRNAAVPST